LPTLLKEMHELGIQQYDQFVYTTDGSTPSFYGQGVIDKMISIALEEGVPEIDAYRMATYNPAKHYGKDHLHGFIGPGRIADLNFLEDPSNPLPVSVLSKGKWIKRNGKQVDDAFPEMNWSDYQMDGLHLDWELSLDDFQFSMPLGMNMVNSVIMKPYSINIDISGDELSLEHDESFLMLVDRKGKWRINTTIKGFANKVMGFASSYSNTGDFILIGKRKKDMFVAFQRMKEIGGGMVLVEDEEVIHEIKLPLAGMMSNLELPSLMKKEETLKMLLEKRGYTFDDPVYTLLFLSSTHLPYIRITPEGIYDVLNKMVLFPSIMR
jgi:adenine deaminase